MRQDEIWDDEAARTYDTPGVGMFDPGLLEATTSRLAELAGGGAVLEFAIGTGRVAIALRDRGVEVSGLELSEPMVARLREKAGPDRLPVVIGDMATATVPGRFALVYLVFNTLSNLLTQDEQVNCFRNAARHLEPGGQFLVELNVPRLRKVPPGQNAAVFAAEPGYVGVDVYDLERQQLVSHHFRFGDGRAARVFRSPHRFVWPAELDQMARLAGFDLESRHADWRGTPFTAESPSHVSVYRLASVGP